MDLLTELEDELREQTPKEGSGVFTSVKAMRQYIEENKPENGLRSRANCVCTKWKNLKNRWRVMCIDKAAKEVFVQANQALECIDRSRQNKFLFAITVWKPKRKFGSLSRELKNYEVGQVYRVGKVYNLQMYNNTAEGNIFAEALVKTEDNGDDTTMSPKKVKTN